MLEAQGQLYKPVQDLSLLETLIALFCFLDTELKVSPLTIVHNYAYVFLLNEAVMVPDNVRMI